MFGPWFVIQCFTSFLVCNHLDWEGGLHCIPVSVLWPFITVPWTAESYYGIL